MEKNAGAFALIPDFKKFKSDNTKTVTEEDEFEQQYDELSDVKIRGLYDDDTIFSIYGKANDKPLPGKGSGEKIHIPKIRTIGMRLFVIIILSVMALRTGACFQGRRRICCCHFCE